jgi:hypothetical protein
MPGYILHATAQVCCFHQGGTALLTSVQPRVTVMGSPVVTVKPITVAPGCPFSNGTSPQPCTTITWTNVSGRVTTLGGQPLLLQAPPGPGPGAGTCMAGAIPQGVPTVRAVQARVVAQ